MGEALDSWRWHGRVFRLAGKPHFRGGSSDSELSRSPWRYRYRTSSYQRLRAWTAASRT